jgi:hypothetical protein
MVELGVQFIGAEEVTGGVPGGPSMVAFNLCVTGVEEDGLAPVAVGEKERRPSGTDSHVEELVGGSPGDGGAEIKRQRRCSTPWTEGRRRLHGPRLGRLGRGFCFKNKRKNKWVLGFVGRNEGRNRKTVFQIFLVAGLNGLKRIFEFD